MVGVKGVGVPEIELKGLGPKDLAELRKEIIPARSAAAFAMKFALEQITLIAHAGPSGVREHPGASSPYASAFDRAIVKAEQGADAPRRGQETRGGESGWLGILKFWDVIPAESSIKFILGIES